MKRGIAIISLALVSALAVFAGVQTDDVQTGTGNVAGVLTGGVLDLGSKNSAFIWYATNHYAKVTLTANAAVSVSNAVPGTTYTIRKIANGSQALTFANAVNLADLPTDAVTNVYSLVVISSGEIYVTGQ